MVALPFFSRTLRSNMDPGLTEKCPAALQQVLVY
jgi:hypothetical protein